MSGTFLVREMHLSQFHHGETVAKSGENYYKLDHGNIYKTDALGTISYDAAHHATNIKPIDFSITKNVFTVMMVGLLMFFMFSSMAKAYKKNESTSGMLSFVEPLVLFVRDDIVKPNIGHNYKKFLPYLLTLFFFILVNNLLGLFLEQLMSQEILRLH